MLHNRVKNTFEGLTEKCRSCSQQSRWGLVVCVSFLVLFTVSAGVTFSFGELLVPIASEVKGSYSLLSWAGAMPASLSSLLAPLATWLQYRFSVRFLAISGILVTSASLFLVSATTTQVELVLVVNGVVSGLALTFVVNPPFYLLEKYFPYSHKYHVLATSISTCGFPLANLIFHPLIFQLESSYGWRFAYMVLAALMVFVGLPAAVTFQPPHQDEHDIENATKVVISHDEQRNTTSVNSSSHSDSKVTKPSVSDPAAAAAGPTSYDGTDEVTALCEGYDKQSDQTYQTHMKTLLCSLWLFASTLKSIGYYVPILTLVAQMEALGIPQWKASNAMVLLGFCDLLSRIFTSVLGDRFKGKVLHIYAICSCLLCVQNFIGMFASSFSQLMIFSAAFGLFVGPFQAAKFSSCFEVMAGQHVPELFSIFRTGLGLGSLLGPAVAGAIYDSTESFRLVFCFNIATYALSATIYIVLVLLNWCRPSCLYRRPMTSSSASSVRSTTATYGSDRPFSSTTSDSSATYEHQHCIDSKTSR